MTRKHFEAIAAVIRNNYSNTENATERKAIQTLAKSLALEFKSINPHFDPNKFMGACGFGL